MRLFTFQPPIVLEQLLENGVFYCNEELARKENPEKEFYNAYAWLIDMMHEKIGFPEVGVTYPVWAWYKYDSKNEFPGWEAILNETDVCLELDIPDDEVVLSDYDEWHCVLNDGPLIRALSEEEFDKKYKEYEKLIPTGEYNKYKKESWNQIFDIKPFKNDFMTIGDYVQATFWRIKKENLVRVIRR